MESVLLNLWGNSDETIFHHNREIDRKIQWHIKLPNIWVEEADEWRFPSPHSIYRRIILLEVFSWRRLSNRWPRLCNYSWKISTSVIILWPTNYKVTALHMMQKFIKQTTDRGSRDFLIFSHAWFMYVVCGTVSLLKQIIHNRVSAW